MSFLLALDSSTECMAIALCGSDGVAAPILFEGSGGALASQQMLPQVRSLLRQAGATLHDVAAVAFGRGPGAFTGLRTACAVAQGLAFGLDVPVLALDSLLLVAEDARQQAVAQGAPLDGPIWVAMDARMGEIYAGQYQFQTGQSDGWETLSEPALYTPPALTARWQQAPAAVCGSGIEPFAAELGLGVETRRWPQSHSRAAALAALAGQAWSTGERLSATAAMPLYVRDKVALTTQERAR